MEICVIFNMLRLTPEVESINYYLTGVLKNDEIVPATENETEWAKNFGIIVAG